MPTLVRLFFSILKSVLFKKLNGTGQNGLARIGKFSNMSRLYLIFIFFIFFYYYIKINIFHKNKNIMNFYKLFTKKHYNNNNYYLY